MAQALAYLLVGCLGSSCQTWGEGGVSFTNTLCCIDFEFLVLNNLVIDCVSGYVSALLNLVGGFPGGYSLIWAI